MLLHTTPKHCRVLSIGNSITITDYVYTLDHSITCVIIIVFTTNVFRRMTVTSQQI